MKDKELKELLLKIDNKLIGIMSLLNKAGEALVEKAKREKGVEIRYSIGKDLSVVDIFLRSIEGKGFKNFQEGADWFNDSVRPLVNTLLYLNVDGQDLG